MRVVRRVVLVVLAAWVIVHPVPALAEEIAPGGVPLNSGDLVERALELDGTRVWYEGEAIGEAMVRGDFAWVHANDDGYHLEPVVEGGGLLGLNSGMAIWMPAQDAESISVFGDHGHVGSVIRVSGILNAACAEHGGDLDIHADSVREILSGRRVAERPRTHKMIAAAVLGILAGIALIGVGRLERRLDQRLYGRA